ncbi:hypothetical protein MUK60_02590 [Streptomyces sp. LRE541]|uniref:hypothetical protein n=1 Tax=Streptomyces sp. LRE541 TaxID=2931983 RepID=UPI00200CD6CC|nr:hypothetical protein [Streptomyces sp. LRE541]UPZ26792.1 hypothetical protein MUK60_02590 [Streptomyces sp. LRE541]
MVRVQRTAVPVVVLLALLAGCSSTDGEDEERLTAQRENYCTQLGAWQKARNAASTDAADAADSAGDDEAGTVARDAFLAMRPLKDESVGQGRTLAEATVAAMSNSDSEAEQRVVEYCGDMAFETLTR